MAVYKPLLAYAKIPENIPEDFVGGDFSEDGAEVVERFSKVLGDEVGGQGSVEAGADSGEGVEGVGEGVDVAEVGD